MARSSEEVLLIVEHVKNKKCEGFLYMMGQRMAWMPQTKKVFSVSHNYSDIKSQKISPDSKDKVQLQIVFHDGGANTFQFLNPQGRDKQKADRDAIKELLLQLLPKFRQQVNSEFAEKGKILQEDPQLYQLYMNLVATGVITAEEFWSTHAQKKLQKNAQKVGVSASFLADIKPQADGCNGLKYNLTVDVIEAIFRTYPMVKAKHLENVPHKMAEQEFWTKFFQSHYVFRDQITQNTKELFSECAKADDESLVAQVQQAAADPLVGLSNFDDNTCGDGYGQGIPDQPEGSKSSTNINASIIKRFNQHSSRVLQLCLEKKSNATVDRDDEDSTDAFTHSQSSTSNGVNSLPSNGLSVKKRKIQDKIQYSDLEASSSTEGGAKLKLTQLGCYLQGPTTETASVYRTTDDVLHACHSVGQEVVVWQVKLDHAVNPGTAMAALSELSPGGALMKGNREWNTSDVTVAEHRQELQQLYVALCELLRHFWQCFPVTTKTLEEKVVQMQGTLQRFQQARLIPFKQKLSDNHMPADYVTHLERMVEQAYEKFNAWKARRTNKR